MTLVEIPLGLLCFLVFFFGVAIGILLGVYATYENTKDNDRGDTGP